MALRASLILIAMLLLAAGDRACAQSDAVKALAGSGAWEISNADRDKACAVTFKTDAARTGYKLELDPACGTTFPFAKDIEGWTLSNDVVRMIDARGRAVIEFNEVESGMYEAERPGEGLYCSAERVRGSDHAHTRPDGGRMDRQTGREADLRDDARYDARFQSGRGVVAAHQARM